MEVEPRYISMRGVVLRWVIVVSLIESYSIVKIIQLWTGAQNFVKNDVTGDDGDKVPEKCLARTYDDSGASGNTINLNAVKLCPR